MSSARRGGSRLQRSEPHLSAPGSSPLTSFRIPTAADCSQGLTRLAPLVASFSKECYV